MIEHVYYQFSTNYVHYYQGRHHIFQIGDVLRLAGFQLSKHTDRSPFHFNADIIRIPNAVITKLLIKYQITPY